MVGGNKQVVVKQEKDWKENQPCDYFASALSVYRLGGVWWLESKVDKLFLLQSKLIDV